jgi:hypothetical protein
MVEAGGIEQKQNPTLKQPVFFSSRNCYPQSYPVAIGSTGLELLSFLKLGSGHCQPQARRRERGGVGIAV